MLLGSDIVYDPGLARCLARLLDRLFRGNEGKGIRALIATALRTKETFDVFLDNLRVR